MKIETSQIPRINQAYPKPALRPVSNGLSFDQLISGAIEKVDQKRF